MKIEFLIDPYSSRSLSLDFSRSRENTLALILCWLLQVFFLGNLIHVLQFNALPAELSWPPDSCTYSKFFQAQLRASPPCSLAWSPTVLFRSFPKTCITWFNFIANCALFFYDKDRVLHLCEFPLLQECSTVL